jgi:GNAT superfamily N-acetyltransferase
MQTMVPTHIRPATADDIERIRTVIAHANEAFRQEVAPALFDAYLASALDVEGRMVDGEVLAADIDGRIVGTITYFADANDEGVKAAFPPLTAGIRATAVDPDAQGAGVGRALVEACIERATVDGARAVALHTAPFMVAAVALYERTGFRRSLMSDLPWSRIFAISGGADAQAIAFIRSIP